MFYKSFHASGNLTSGNPFQIAVSIVLVLSALLSACSGDKFDDLAIGGTVSGLSGTGLVLRNNGGDDLAINGNGSFTFAATVQDTKGYSVTVRTQPSTPNQVCTVTNGSGAVNGANVTDVTVTCVSAYTIGGTVSGLNGTGLVLQNNAANNLTITANGSFTFTVPLADTSTYAVTVSAQPSTPNQVCTVTNNGGVLAGADITNVSVACINTYTVGGTVTGLSGSGLVLQNNAGDDLTITADGSFTFATALADLSAYAVTVLTQPGTPSQTCAVTVGGGALAGVNVTNVNIVCVINTYTVGGIVYGLSGTGLVLQNNAGDDLTIIGNGSFSFATALADLSAYAVTILIQPGTPSQLCTVISGSSSLAGANASDVKLVCNKYAYAANASSDDVSQYTISAVDGSLSAMSTATVAAGTTPQSITVDPSGRYAYVANATSGNVSQYTISAVDGSLSPMSTATVDAGTTPRSVIVDPLGRYAYVANAGGDVSQYSINSDGSLSAMTPATVTAGTMPQSVTVDPLGQYAYVANAGGDVSQYSINSDGSLSAMTPATVAAGTSPISVVVDPSSQYAYVANAGGATVSQYTISAADGSLSAMPLATVTAGTTPQSVTVDPSGRYAYVANAGGDVSQYTISAADGSLSAMAPATVAAGTTPQSIAIDPLGQYAYVANAGGDVSQYTINLDGSLSAMTPATVAAGTAPISITITK